MTMQIELEKITEYADGVIVYADGRQTVYPVGGDEFKEICAEWNAMIDGAHQMPAYGVSLNAETVRALKEGIWVEFTFPRLFSSNGMPFEKLLVNVQPSWSGFNIVRYTVERGYDGRCFYYDLVGKDMSSFYNLISEK